MCFNGGKKLGLSALRNLPSTGFLPTAEQAERATCYKRVVIFGVDGAGDYFNKCDVPNFRRIYESGSVTYTALSQFPTISAQNWTSVLHGVRYQTHRITNEIAAVVPYSKNKYPSLFKVYSLSHPEAKFASVVNWFPINRGIVEVGIKGMKKINAGAVVKGEKTTDRIDETVVSEVKRYISENDPTILFTHFDGPDHAGHAHGYGSKEYEKAVQKADTYLGEIFDAYRKNGWDKDTLFITVSDHGHVIPKDEKSGGGHGGWTETERNVTIAVSGGLGDIIPGNMGASSTLDVASIALYALGETQPDSWESRVPENIFNTLKK